MLWSHNTSIRVCSGCAEGELNSRSWSLIAWVVFYPFMHEFSIMASAAMWFCVTGFFQGGVISPAPAKCQFLHKLLVLDSHPTPPDEAHFLIRLLYWRERWYKHGYVLYLEWELLDDQIHFAALLEIFFHKSYCCSFPRAFCHYRLRVKGLEGTAEVFTLLENFCCKI